jgi:hypothetical protein
MKAKIDCYTYDFATQVALLATDTGRPIVKNANGIIVIYLRNEAERELFEKQFYKIANRYARAYISVKFKKHTPILDRRYKNKEANK